MIGVNFQPGASYGDQPGAPKPQSQQGVQDAIKVLSLRLPKVVGAQAAAPQALLTAPGSGGSRVDSVVNQVMARIMPQGQPQQPPQANLGSMPESSAPANAPSFSGAAQANYQRQEAPQPSWQQFLGPTPRVVIGGPLAPKYPGMAGVDGGAGFPPAMIDTLPENFNIPSPLPTPQKRSPFPNLDSLLGGSEQSYERELF